MRNNVSLLFLIISVFLLMGSRTIVLPDIVVSSEGTVVDRTVVEEATRERFIGKWVFTNIDTDDDRYVLYPKSLILSVLSQIPKPMKFEDNAFSNCNHAAIYYKACVQQTLQGAPTALIGAFRIQQNYLDEWIIVGHLWIAILADDYTFVEWNEGEIDDMMWFDKIEY